jgi:hypothetical protein
MLRVVTVVDENPINLIASKILIAGLIIHSTQNYQIEVLINGNVANEYLNWLKDRKVNIIVGKIDASKDRYKTKLLLINHVIKHEEDSEYLLYLDPDHLVLKDFSCFFRVRDCLIVSSEQNDLEKEISGYRINKHHNTSLIYGDMKKWRRIVNHWEYYYDEIRNVTSFRHKEEIAFTISALSNEIDLTLASKAFQSGFHNNTINTCLFHYGGDYYYSKKIKRYMKDITELKNYIKISSEVPESNIEQILCGEIRKILESDKW